MPPPSTHFHAPPLLTMAYSRVSSAALAALFTLFPGDFQAASFVAPSPHLVIGKVAAVQKNNQQTHHVVPSTSSEEVQLPPKDGSFGLIGTVRHLLALPDVPKNAKKYDRIGHETGGIWRSAMMGVEACTVSQTKPISVLTVFSSHDTQQCCITDIPMGL